MLEEQIAELILQSGGILAAIMAVLVMLRKVWGMMSTGHLETVKNAAESALYTNMRKEMDRLREDIGSMRENYRTEIEELRRSHERERQELVSRIRLLEDALQNIQQVNDRVKKDALAILDHIKNSESEFNDEIVDLLSRIVRDMDSRIKTSRTT